MHITLTLMFVVSLTILIAIVGGFYIKRKLMESTIPDSPISLPHAIRYGEPDTRVMLKCSNLRLGYLVLGTMFWAFAILMTAMAMANSKDPDTALTAKKVADAVIDNSYMKFMPFVFIGIGFYFAYSRVRITWDNGVLIDDKPVRIIAYNIKKMSKSIDIIYLRSANGRWILCPATSQDNRKFKNLELLKREQAFNQTQIAQLRTNLSNAGVSETNMSFFTPYIMLGFAAFIITAICVVLVYS